MKAEDFDAWVERYVAAWDTNDAAEIGGLFTDEAEYYTAPFRDPRRGRSAIVAGWLEDRDEPRDHEFEHEVIGVDGDLGFVRGTTRYHVGAKANIGYANLWMIRLVPDGRASSFTEWWMEEK